VCREAIKGGTEKRNSRLISKNCILCPPQNLYDTHLVATQQRVHAITIAALAIQDKGAQHECCVYDLREVWELHSQKLEDFSILRL